MGMSVKQLQKIIEQQGWNVSIEKLGKKAKCVELQRFTPAGQDFNISVEMTGNDVKSFIHNLNECYDSYDPDYEAYLWIGEDGHGKNGAPYHIKDIVEDMEAAEKYILNLYLTLEEKYGK